MLSNSTIGVRTFPPLNRLLAQRSPPCHWTRIPVYPQHTVPKEGFALMILTCPSCGTQYVVKDGAIPPQGRQVRCASCKHSWHQDPEPGAELEQADPNAQEAPVTGPKAE